MCDIQIVKLMPEEWLRYREIRLESLREEPQAFGSSSAVMAEKPETYWQGRLAEALQGEKSWLLFAQEGEHVIGMIGAFCDEAQVFATIVSVYVSKEARGKGTGKILMEGILSEIGKKANLHKVVLGVNREQIAAVELYRRFGFLITGEREEVQGDGKSPRGYVMEKELR